MSGRKTYLLDTNVVSEMRRKRADPTVVSFLKGIHPDSLFISALTLGEIVRGIALRRQTDPEGADALEVWLSELEEQFADRIVPVDGKVGNCWGRLSADRSRPVVDTLIAATALVRGMALVTRNVDDFQSLGVELVNPWLSQKIGKK